MRRALVLIVAFIALMNTANATNSSPKSNGNPNNNSGNSSSNASSNNSNSNSNKNFNNNQNKNNNSNKNSNNNSNNNSNKNSANATNSNQIKNDLAQGQEQAQLQGQLQGQQQSANLSNIGNASLENVGNSQASAAAGATSGSLSGADASAVNGDVQSTISIVGDTNVYKAPVIPVNAAPPSFATLCTGAMAGTTMRLSFSQSSVTLICDLQNASTATFTQSMRNWWMIDNRYIPQMEDLDNLIFETEIYIKTMQQELKDLEDQLQQGQRKGTVAFSKYDRVEEIRKLKEKIAANELLLKKYQASYAKVEERIIKLTEQAETFMDYSNNEMHIMHVTVTSRSHRVTSRLATFAQNIFAPLGFIAIAKEVF